MIDWTRYRDSTPEERATLPRPLSPERLARRYGVSRRSLMRWWSKEVRTVLDAVCPSPGPTAVYQAIKAVQDLARTLRRPDLTLPVSYEHLEQRALAIFDRTSRDLPPEDRALLSALVSSGLLVFIAGMTEEGPRSRSEDPGGVHPAPGAPAGAGPRKETPARLKANAGSLPPRSRFGACIIRPSDPRNLPTPNPVKSLTFSATFPPSARAHPVARRGSRAKRSAFHTPRHSGCSTLVPQHSRRTRTLFLAPHTGPCLPALAR